MLIALTVSTWLGWRKFGESIRAHDCGLAYGGLSLNSPDKDKIAILEHEICAGGFGTGSDEDRVKIHTS